MPAKDQRLEARVTDSQKELFQRAADIQGQSLTDFMISTLQERARQVVKDHDIMILSEEDRAVFIEALLNPPPPNEKLRNALKTHREVLDQTNEPS